MKPLKEIFLELNLSPKLKKNLFLLEFLQKNWEKITGKDFCFEAIPSLIKDEILWIEVSNHYIFQILSGKTLIFLKKIKECLPKEFKGEIREIRFKINPFLEISSKNEKKVKVLPSNSQKLKTFLRLCEEIKDPELKKSFVKMFKSYAKLKNSMILS